MIHFPITKSYFIEFLVNSRDEVFCYGPHVCREQSVSKSFANILLDQKPSDLVGLAY